MYTETRQPPESTELATATNNQTFFVLSISSSKDGVFISPHPISQEPFFSFHLDSSSGVTVAIVPRPFHYSKTLTTTSPNSFSVFVSAEGDILRSEESVNAEAAGAANASGGVITLTFTQPQNKNSIHIQITTWTRIKTFVWVTNVEAVESGIFFPALILKPGDAVDLIKSQTGVAASLRGNKEEIPSPFTILLRASNSLSSGDILAARNQIQDAVREFANEDPEGQLVDLLTSSLADQTRKIAKNDNNESDNIYQQHRKGCIQEWSKRWEWIKSVLKEVEVSILIPEKELKDARENSKEEFWSKPELTLQRLRKTITTSFDANSVEPSIFEDLDQVIQHLDEKDLDGKVLLRLGVKSESISQLIQRISKTFKIPKPLSLRLVEHVGHRGRLLLPHPHSLVEGDSSALMTSAILDVQWFASLLRTAYLEPPALVSIPCVPFIRRVPELNTSNEYSRIDLLKSMQLVIEVPNMRRVSRDNPRFTKVNPHHLERERKKVLSFLENFAGKYEARGFFQVAQHIPRSFWFSLLALSIKTGTIVHASRSALVLRRGCVEIVVHEPSRETNLDDLVEDFGSLEWESISVVAHTFIPKHLVDDFEKAKTAEAHPLTYPALLQAFWSTFILQLNIVESLLKECQVFLYNLKMSSTGEMPDELIGHPLVHRWVLSETGWFPNGVVPICSFGQHCALRETHCSQRVLTRLDRGRCDCGEPKDQTQQQQQQQQQLVCADCGICRRFCAPTLAKVQTEINPANVVLMEAISTRARGEKVFATSTAGVQQVPRVYNKYRGGTTSTAGVQQVPRGNKETKSQTDRQNHPSDLPIDTKTCPPMVLYTFNAS